MTGVSVFPKGGSSVQLGSVEISGNRVISLRPAIARAFLPSDLPEVCIPDSLIAFKIIISGPLPKSCRDRVIDCSTTLSFVTTNIPAGEDPFDCRFFFEHVEWKDPLDGWTFGVEDPLWDSFIQEYAESGRAGTIEFLGIARQVEGPSRDTRVRELLGEQQVPLIGCWYKLPEGE